MVLDFASPLATPLEAAQFLKVSRTHIYNLCDAGELTSRRVGNTRRVLWSEIEALAGVSRRELMASDSEVPA